ncbi:cytochrome P450 [Streptomyces sp. PCS3-D2]|uniref:cytochrome P450 n=1 Tax=Streptomyces sp. PCS3-D2 TaxID=1460244 RepID=UPI00044BA4F4|nr:cytochrome P450 [Streptomyces sp. PCS3-D2]WKV71290.1 cytochrome P450 [Streptomyces sp. PCS3-D2]
MTLGRNAGSAGAGTSAGTGVPVLPGAPLLGSLHDLKSDSLGTYLRARQWLGDVVRVSAGPPGMRSDLYCVFSPEGVQQVLASQSANFRKDNPFYQEVRDSFGNGLLTSQDEDYLRQRRLVQPLFTRRRVDGYAGAVAAETASVVTAWQEAPDGVVDLSDEMTHLALRAVARILFGTDVEATADVVARCFPVITDYVLRRGYSPATVPRHWPTPANRRAAAAMDELYGVCDQIIGQRRRDRAPAPAPDGQAPAAGATVGQAADEDLLTLLAAARSSQDRARTEITRVLGDRTPQARDLDRLPYLSQVVKEAMRLYPAAPVIGRRAVAATRIGEHTIPAGADVILAPWVTHRHPEYWPDPDRFDPERFTPEAEAGRPRYAWFPFGGGPRACIGQHFSMLESVVALAMILRTYAFEAVDTRIPVGAGITLRTEGPARCRVRRVDR